MASRPRYLLNRDGRYFARLVVPPDLRPFLEGDAKGKTELREPLGPDYRTACQRLHGAVAGIQHQIAMAERRKHAATATPLPIAPRYLLSDDDLARRVYETRLAADERLRNVSADHARAGVDAGWIDQLRQGMAGALTDGELHDLVGFTIDRMREAGNTSADYGSTEWRRLARVICQGMLEAAARTTERNAGNFAGVPSPMFQPREEPAPHVPVRLRDIFKRYLEARAKVGRGREAGKAWPRIFDDLAEHVGHDDVSRYTKADIRSWRDAKLETLSARTVGQSYLAAVRTVLTWAVQNDLLEDNPAADVHQPIPKAIRGREQGYTLEEAQRVLDAARAHQPVAKDGIRTRETPTTTAAKRWLPWLAAFTGARIAELAQLRREDVRQEQGAWILRLTPEAGTIKTRQYRDVPLHPQLIELGFLDYVQTRTGPLFYEPAPGRDPIMAARKVGDNVGAWLRKSELVPEGVSPNHGWRHRFKTVGLEAGIPERVLDALCGHASRTSGESYGDVTIKTRVAAIGRLPCYNVTLQKNR